MTVTKTKKSISNFLDGITPEPIKTNFQLITSSISDALKPILTLFKPLKIFIPILKLFGAGFLKSLNLFKKSNKAVAKNNDTIKQHTVLTKDQMDATKKQTVLTKEQMEMQMAGVVLLPQQQLLLLLLLPQQQLLLRLILIAKKI